LSPGALGVAAGRQARSQSADLSRMLEDQAGGAWTRLPLPGAEDRL